MCFLEDKYIHVGPHAGIMKVDKNKTHFSHILKVPLYLQGIFQS